MATAFILSSRTVSNGVLTSRHSRWSAGFPSWQRKLGNIKELSAAPWLLVSAEKAGSLQIAA